MSVAPSLKPGVPGAHPLFPIVARTRLLFFALPLALVVVGIRACFWTAPGTTFPQLPSLDPSVLFTFISAAIFVVALLLNGTMADYKESEKLPAEIESLFTSLHAQARHGSRLKSFDPLPSLRAIHRMLHALARFLDATLDYSAALEEFSQGEDALMFELDSKGIVGTTATHLFNLRAKISRINVIRDTSFLPVAYMLADGLVALVIALLITTKNASPETGYVIAAVFSCLFLYLSLLIRDIDDPLEYHDRLNERMLEAEALIQPSLRSAISTASSIDFSTVFLVFGVRLHKDLSAKGVDVRAVYAASLASKRTLAGADAGAAGAAGDSSGGDAGNMLQPAVFAAITVESRT